MNNTVYTIDMKLKSFLPAQKKKYSRVRTMDDDGEDDEKDQIADEIFTRDGDGEGEEGGEGGEALHPGDDEEEEEGEESGSVSSSVWHSRLNTIMPFMLLFTCVVLICTDIDDFIVDDDGQPITKKKGKKFTGYTDA